jgi:transposase
VPTVTESQPEPTRRRGRCPGEFRRDAVALVIDQHPTVADVVPELGQVGQTLGLGAPGAGRPGRERRAQCRRTRRMVRLRREVKRLATERDLLKVSVAFWVKELCR